MASQKKTDQTVRLATMEQLKQLIAIIVQAIPTRISFEQAKYWIGHATELGRKIREIFAVADPYREQVAAWQRFYRDELGLTVDLSALSAPDPKPDLAWLVVVVPDVTIEMVLTAMKKHFPVWRWTQDDLDRLTESVRSAKDGPYAIWVRDRQEADQEHTGKSYDDIKAAGINGITLLEYCLLYLGRFIATGRHLDSENITLCTGSLCSGGRVPDGFWRPGDGRFCVHWYDRGDRLDSLRCREVVL